MARSRNIKPGFFTNDTLGELPALARLMFAGLWTICDRAGRCEDRPKKIKAEVLPYDVCDADDLLGQLQKAGFIHRYVVGGVAVIQVQNWDKHQNPHMKEAPSSLPARDQHGASPMQAPCEQLPQPERAGLIPDSGFLIPDPSSPTVHTAAAAAPAGRKRRPGTPLPAEFGVSERVGKWAAEKGYGQLTEHLEAFKRKVAANDYRKASWDDAFMEAIREDWAKLRGRAPSGAAPPPDAPRGPTAADKTKELLDSYVQTPEQRAASEKARQLAMSALKERRIQ
jgi:hypothetical protein